MKVDFKAPAKTGNDVLQQMPKEIQDTLAGKSLRQACDAGLVNDLGDAEGNLLVKSAREGVDATYAVVNGHAVPLSKELAGKEDEEVLGMLDTLEFFQGVSTIGSPDPKASDYNPGHGRAYFRLGMPSGIRIGERSGNIAAMMKAEGVTL